MTPQELSTETTRVRNATEIGLSERVMLIPSEMLGGTNEVRKPSGPVAAALVAAGVGSAALGLLIPLAEASTTARTWMILNNGVGALSGKTTFAVVVWLVAWGALHLLWRHRQITLERVFLVTTLLLMIGLLGTFPPVFTLFAPAH